MHLRAYCVLVISGTMSVVHTWRDALCKAKQVVSAPPLLTTTCRFLILQ